MLVCVYLLNYGGKKRSATDRNWSHSICVCVYIKFRHSCSLGNLFSILLIRLCWLCSAHLYTQLYVCVWWRVKSNYCADWGNQSPGTCSAFAIRLCVCVCLRLFYPFDFLARLLFCVLDLLDQVFYQFSDRKLLRFFFQSQSFFLLLNVLPSLSHFNTKYSINYAEKKFYTYSRMEFLIFMSDNW